MTKRWMNTAGIAAMMVLAAGCLPDTEPAERQRASVDHDTVQQAVADHSKVAAESVVEAVVLLESSALADEFSGAEECVYYGPEEDDVDCQPTGGPDASAMEDEYDELVDILEQRVFHADNVETETGDSVTYLLQGDVVCDEDDFYEPANYDSCVDEVNDVEFRVHVVHYTDGTMEFDVMVGPDEIHPVTLSSSELEVAVTANLDQFEPAAQHIADVTGEDTGQFPDQFSGQIRAALSMQADQTQLAVDILQDLEIDGGDFSLFVEAVGQVFSIGVDTGDELFEVDVDFGEIAVDGQTSPPQQPVAVEPEDDDDWEEPEQPDPVDFGVEMAGLTSTVVFDPGASDVQYQNVGLGGAPTRLFVDGQEVVTIDLDAGVGGMFDAAMQLYNDDLKVSVQPGVELEIGLMFHRVADQIDDVEGWMLDEVLTLALAGDPKPAVVMGQQGLEVLRGHLSLKSEATDAGATVYAGQCLIDEPVGDVVGPDEPQDDDAWDDSYHPFDGFEAGQCQ